MANNLKDHLKEVADAIRAKKGTSDLINPQDFATEIEGISGSGGESGDGIKMIYLDLSAMGDVSVEMAKAGFGILNALAKVDDSIASVAALRSTITSPVKAVAIPLGMRTYVDNNNDITVSEDSLNEFLGEGWQDMQITKEQFYDLNA